MSDYITFDNRGKLRRKAKKELLGTLMSKTRLRKLLDSVQIIENKYPDESTILPYPFLPKMRMQRNTINRKHGRIS